MNIALCYLCLAFAVISAGAAEARYRKVGDTYYDLQPIFDWHRLKQAQLDKKTTDLTPRPRPMPLWICQEVLIGQRLERNDPRNYWYRVNKFDVADTNVPGYLLEKRDGTRLAPVSDNQIFLINYQGRRLKDDDEPIFYAIKTGMYQYKDVSGALRTVPLYDCGIPYDPAGTNRPATKGQTGKRKK